MGSSVLRYVILAAIFLAVASYAQATTVVVTPVTMVPDANNMKECTNGWTIRTNMSAEGELCAHGPTLSETYFGFDSSTGENFGNGAFYASCGTEGQGANADDKTPSTSWLGTDVFNGQSLAGKRLNQITKLDYWTYVSRIPTRFGGTDPTGNWDSWTWWRYPKQPITVQLTAQTSDGQNRRTFCHRPWGTSVKGDDYNETAIGNWQHWNATESGRWWALPSYYEGGATSSYESWSAMMSSTLNGQVIGTWTLVPTTYPGDYYCSPGYKGSTTPGGFTCSTGTGKCLNFEVGARFVNMTKWPDGSNTNWFTESINFRGHMDHFTLGVDGVNVAYDFEPAPGDVGPRNVFTNQRNLNKSLTAMGTRIQNNFMFKITGKVKNRLNAYFDLDDGTGNALPTRVYWMNNFAQVGQTWEVWGFIERARWSPGSTPYLVWTDDSHARRID